MENLKLIYLKEFFNRCQLSVEDFVQLLKSSEETIRSFYAAPINGDDFLKMILVDACFIIEFFLRFNYGGPFLLEPWMEEYISVDLILMENQLPFFVLEQLYSVTGMDRQLPSFLEICFFYFRNYGLGVVGSPVIENPKHITDCLRSSIISSSMVGLQNPKESQKFIKSVYSASQLQEAGLKFKVRPNQSLLDLTYSEHGVLNMPILNIYDVKLYINLIFGSCNLKNNFNVKILM